MENNSLQFQSLSIQTLTACSVLCVDYILLKVEMMYKYRIHLSVQKGIIEKCDDVLQQDFLDFSCQKTISMLHTFRNFNHAHSHTIIF